MDAKIIELSLIELKEISGGNLFKIGRAIGRYCADFVDFYHGVSIGLGLMDEK